MQAATAFAVPAPPADLLKAAAASAGIGADAIHVPAAPPVPSHASLGLPPPSSDVKAADAPLPAFSLDDDSGHLTQPLGQHVPDDMLPTVALHAIVAPSDGARPSQNPEDRSARSMRDVAESIRKSIRPGELVKYSRDKLPRARDWLVASSKQLPKRAAELVEIAKQNPRDPRVLITAAVAVVVLGTIVSLSMRGKRQSTAEAASSDAVRNGTSDLEPMTCRPVKTPVRLAAKVNKDVALELLVPPGGDRVLVGYASDAGTARGVAVASESGQVTDIASTSAADHARAVIPTMVSSQPSLLVSTDKPDDPLRGWRVLSTDPVSMVGQSAAGLGIVVRPGGNVRSLWPLEGEGAVESLRAIELGRDGYSVVFRRRGAIWMGMLDGQRAARGALTRVPGAGAPPGSPVGSPTVGYTGRGTVVAFADRASTSEPWSIRLGVGTGTNAPSTTVPFSVPSGGPGKDAIAPSVAGLGDGRVLLVWTEGAQDHDVRAQLLGPDLSPAAPAFAISRPGTNAGQGAVAIRDGRGMVAYLERGATDGYEMWGVPIECK